MRTLNMVFHAFPEISSGGVHIEKLWEDSWSPWSNLTTLIPAANLGAKLAAEAPFPETIPTGIKFDGLWEGAVGVAESSSRSGPPPSLSYGGIIAHRRMWLQIAPAAEETIHRSYIKVTERSNDTNNLGSAVPHQSTFAIERVDVTIPKGKTESSPFDLVGDLNGTGGPPFDLEPNDGNSPLTAESFQQYFTLVELTAHKRGTIDAPGAAIARPGGSEIYEAVTLENADYDETDWQPTSMTDGPLEDKQDGKTDTVSKDKDDDFVKLRFSCPLTNTAGSSEIVFDQAGQGERMQAADIRFHNSKGERIQLSALKIDDLKNPSGPLAPAFTIGLDLFVEIADLGEITGQSAQADDITRKYADLIWKITIAGTTVEQKVRIYRGGFWRADRTNNTGTIALYDGKGLKPDNTIDYGQIVKGPYQIKTGRPRNGVWVTDETVTNYGPTPMGWYGLWARNRGNNNTDMRTGWSEEGDRPQTNHHLDAVDNFLGFIQQGSYSQWAEPGNHNIEVKGAYGYDNENNSAPYQGMPVSIHFKVELLEIGDFTTRTFLQIHPDGFNDGSAGCVAVQTYDECCKVLFLQRHYFQTRILVD